MPMLRDFEKLLTALEDLTHGPGRHSKDYISTQIYIYKKTNTNQTELSISINFYSGISVKDAMSNGSTAQIRVRVATGGKKKYCSGFIP